ncbi:hypothetical protein ACEN9X_05125 [Mucilaginibacter sp. Mucisp86]|uniref:hypothetical protein n=1 Tax=Mucilaginibacter sp. Mucisp86 TaxID=3243060 RepID=UPI0039B6D601
MKKPILILIIVLIASFARAQSNEVPALTSPNNENVIYRIFPTTNIYNLIKLDTRNGKMWKVQWNAETEKRFTSDINSTPFVAKDDEKNGRFILQATPNIFTFILLDQIDGRTWEVHWSNDPEKRGVIAIN